MSFPEIKRAKTKKVEEHVFPTESPDKPYHTAHVYYEQEYIEEERLSRAKWALKMNYEINKVKVMIVTVRTNHSAEVALTRISEELLRVAEADEK